MPETLNTIAMYIGYGCMASCITLITFSWYYGRTRHRNYKRKYEDFYKGKNFDHLNK